MSDAAWIVASMASGLALGAFFFGGLWWTVNRLPMFERPALAMVGSLLLRTGVTLGGFFVVSAGHWPRWVACLAGFTVARLALRWTTHAKPGVSA